MRARLRDVAELAGVSTSTASLVLTGKGASRISAATNARVRSAAARLSYVPRAPRDAALCVGLLLDVQGSGCPVIDVVEAAQAEAWRLGHGPVLAARLGPDRDVDDVSRGLRERGSAALLCMGLEGGPVPRVTLALPTVYVNCYPTGVDQPGRRHVVVRTDEQSAARQAALEVVRQGHRNAGLVAGSTEEDVIDLWQATATTIWATAGGPGRPEVNRVESGRPTALERLLARAATSRPTALVCLDELAVAVVRRAAAAQQLADPPPGVFIVARGPVRHPFPTPGLPEPVVTVGAAVSDLARAGMRTLLDGARWRAGTDVAAPTEQVLLPACLGAGTSWERPLPAVDRRT